MALLSSRPSRLYSMFPAGSVGLALLLLRLVDGFGLAAEGIHLVTPATTSLEPASVLFFGLTLISSALLLMLGLRTSFAGSIAAICTAGATVYGSRHLTLSGTQIDAWLILFALVFFLSSSLVLLGPGGYSLDARLSGWRMIKLATRQSDPKDAD
jgi:hypothetical protein